MKNCRWIYGLLLTLTGCTAYQNPASLAPPAFSAEELSARIHLKVAVRLPEKADFELIKDAYMREAYYDLAVSRANRLVAVLRGCQVVDSISIENVKESYDVVIVDLPVKVERTGLDDPMALIYGGVLPVYSKDERGVRFGFLKGGSGDFTFTWTESKVIAIWAPVVAAGNSKWETSRKSTKYWYDLRAELLKTFSSINR